MPVFRQNTFTLIREREAPVTDEPIRPMTSKQVKKAHKAANKPPKLSRAEQRKLELAEQERIRKEIEKDRQANRARAARDKKKEKENREKEERRRNGRPLVDVRPSQETMARFLKGPSRGKKEDTGGNGVARMAPVVEEEPETEDDVEVVEQQAGGNPVYKPDSQQEHDPNEREEASVELDPERRVQPEPAPKSENKHSQDSEEAAESELCEIREDCNQEVKELLKQGADRQESPKSQGSQVEPSPGKPTPLTRASSHSPLPPETHDQWAQAKVEEPVESNRPLRVPASQIFSDDWLDDDSMQELEAAAQQEVNRGNAWREPAQHDDNLLQDSAPLQAAETYVMNRGNPGHQPEHHDNLSTPDQQRPELLATQRSDYDDLDDDAFAGISTQAVAQWEEQDRGSVPSEQASPSLKGPAHAIEPSQASQAAGKSDMNGDSNAIDTLKAMSKRDFSIESAAKQFTPLVVQPSTLVKLHPEQARLEPPRPAPVAKLDELCSFNEDDLDDDLLHQLDIELQAEGSAATKPIRTAEPTPSIQPPIPPASHQPSPGLMRPPPFPQPPPMSTQAVLSRLDDYFPSPSQQERELDNDLGNFQKTQPTPCPPPKRPRPRPRQPQCPPEHSPMQPPKSQKRFFSASGENERLHLVMHRSKRDAALDDIHRKENQRLEAGKLQAKQTATQGRQFMAHRQNGVRPRRDQASKPPRPAGRPPAWVTNEVIEPPPKRQKMIRTESQTRPPAFKQSTATKTRDSPKPPVFKPKTNSPPQAADKENDPFEGMPPTSQGSDYGGDWIDDMAMDMASAGRGCLSATQMTLDRGNGVCLR